MTEREMQHELSMTQAEVSRANQEEQFIFQKMGTALNVLTQVNPAVGGYNELKADAITFLRAAFRRGATAVAALPIIQDEDEPAAEDDGPASVPAFSGARD